LFASKLNLSAIYLQNLIFLCRFKTCDWFIEKIIIVFLPLLLPDGGKGAVSD
jgi:hypothetical protein